jgi:deoxyribonuclease II
MEAVTTAPFYNVVSLKSTSGTNFVSFAKSRKFNKELYEDLAAPYFDSGDYYVESWRHGAGNIESDCTKPAKVYNIEQIEFKTANITFKTLRDHSKWMVNAEKKLICVGDINRQVSFNAKGFESMAHEMR